ncbi:MAG: recombinase family protein [Bacteroidales bacterium]|nr:recombinase family protein [Bacteroidales bacterium]
MSILSPELRSKTWLMYLRKSRQDDPNETVEEVLGKHHAMLQDWALRELGRTIPEENIFREIVSGERIADRRELQKVLRKIESPDVAGIICRDCSRLSRGDLIDCGSLMTVLQYTSTLVATPMMVYDLEDKKQKQFFQDELLRGSYYLDYTKEVLTNGREIAVTKRGAYIGSKAPYGYKKVKIGKLCTLEPHETEADVVRMIFDLYVNQDVTFHSIGRQLDAMGIMPRTGTHWRDTSIRQIVANHHYDGKVVWGKRKTKTMIEEGKVVQHRRWSEDDDFAIVDGMHPALIDHEMFVKANEKRTNNPRIIRDLKLSNPLAGLLVCSKCGHVMRRVPYTQAEDRFACHTQKPACMKSIRMKDVYEAVIVALEQSELPELQAKLNSNQGSARAIQQKILEGLKKQLAEYKVQEENQYELLETKKYTLELFEKRNAALREKMKQCEKQIWETECNMPKEVDYAERIVALEDAIRALKDESMPIEDKNRFLKKIIEKIEITTFSLPKRSTGCHLKIDLLI